MPVRARWVATIPHGLPADLYAFSGAGAGGYLAFLGRVRPEKRPDRAIEVARRVGVPLMRRFRAPIFRRARGA